MQVDASAQEQEARILRKLQYLGSLRFRLAALVSVLLLVILVVVLVVVMSTSSEQETLGSDPQNKTDWISRDQVPYAQLGALEADTTYRFRRSTDWGLLTLVKKAKGSTSRWPIPCARSYESHDWEVVRPRSNRPNSLVQLHSCDLSFCVLSLPADTDHTYYFVDLKDSIEEISPDSIAPGYSDSTWNSRAAAHLLM